MKEIDPHPYGDEFTSVEQLMETVKEREEKGMQTYGHAIIFVSKDGELPQRIAARVDTDGNITVGAHCEWI